MSGIPDREDGAVLLTTLLIMSIMATLAVSIMDDVGFALRRAATLEDTAQAQSYLDGAEGYALLHVRNEIAGLPRDQLSQLLSVPQGAVLPLDDGTVELAVRDGSHCLSPHLALDADGEALLARLFAQLGVPPREATTLAASLKDWQDADPSPSPGGAEDGSYLLLEPSYRTAGSPVGAISELRAVRGFDVETWTRVAPWLCLNGGAPVNVDTLPPADAPLLAALLDRDTAFAASTLASRPPGGWGGVEAFTSALGVTDPKDIAEYFPFGFDALAFEPGVLRVDAVVRYRGQVRRSALWLPLDGSPPVVHRARGEAALPLPRPPADGSGGDESIGGGTDG